MSKKSLLFNLLNEEPESSAQELCRRASDAGVQISALTAYRAIRAYRSSGGQIEKSETRGLRIISSILQEANEGEHLTAIEIMRRSAERNFPLHKATVYRVLANLSAIGLVQAVEKKRQQHYEWKRDGVHHGHLSCIQCGQIVEFHQDQLDEIANGICERLGYSFYSIEYVVRSLCGRCRGIESDS